MKAEALEGGLPNITCQIGQCASSDDAERLKADVERLTMRLQATEADLHATTANLEATEKAWEESVSFFFTRAFTLNHCWLMKYDTS
ncbi:hypothetical protein BC629DRAFT_1543587 [Irpex lacteus]|nr:hypothetical protein BC629DRAFT_1543587 [Irpex lacteus]